MQVISDRRRIPALTFAALLFARCSTQRSAGSEPPAISLCPRPDTPVAASLSETPPELQSLATSTSGNAVRTILGEIAQEAVRRRYTNAEINDTIHSFAHLVADENANLAALSATSDEPRLPGADDAIVMYVNPTCDECERAASVVVHARTLCPETFPAVVFRLLPAPETRSVDAAAALEAVHRDRTSLFPDLVVQFLNALPDNDSPIDALVPNELGVTRFADLPSYAAARQAFAGSSTITQLDQYVAPIVIFHNRIVQRDVTAGVGFDPLHDPRCLLSTINAIRLLDSTKHP